MKKLSEENNLKEIFDYDLVLKNLNKDYDIECMDRIGFTDDGYEVFIVTDDYKLSEIPHFHYRKKEKGKPCEFHTCIRFDCPEYYHHIGKEDVLDDKQKANLIKFLNDKCKIKKSNWTNWIELIMSWNHQNDDSICIYKEIPIPNYMKLK